MKHFVQKGQFKYTKSALILRESEVFILKHDIKLGDFSFKCLTKRTYLIRIHAGVQKVTTYTLFIGYCSK